LPKCCVIGAKQEKLIGLGEESKRANLGFKDSQERVKSSHIVGGIALFEQHLIIGFGISKNVQEHERIVPMHRLMHG